LTRREISRSITPNIQHGWCHFYLLHRCIAIYRAVKNFQPEEGVFSGSLHKMEPDQVQAEGGDADRRERCQPQCQARFHAGEDSESPINLEEEEECLND
jgi:hypothetical protein